MRKKLLACLQFYVRRFPIDKGKNRLINSFWKPLLADSPEQLTTLKQAPLTMKCDISKHIQRDIFFWGTYHYEEKLLNFWVKQARLASTIFDIGANVGIYSLLAAATNSQAVVHAFEPTPGMADKLREHLTLNKIANVKLNQMAIGKTDENGYVHICKGDNDLNEGMNFVTTESSSQCEMTQIRSIDSYCTDNQIYRIDLLKMDIEGGEYHALLGMRHLLANKAIGCMFLELTEWSANRSGHTTLEIKKLLLDYQYHLYELPSATLRPLSPVGPHIGEANILAFAKPPSSLVITH